MSGPQAPAAVAENTPRRRRVTVRGVVQGVGFRPYLYGLATELALAGHVTNTPEGVVAEVEGNASAVARFCDLIAAQAPPLARVESVHHREMPPVGGTAFTILTSRTGGPARTLVSPDSATCADCLAELAAPADRRHRHPFVNCTHCGPRFTIVTGVPYDRANTTMAGFAMCADCAREYEDPADRRFHAQPVACPACGPRLRLVLAQEARIGRVERADPVTEARALLTRGAILAVKGLGGYHLACDASNQEAVALLRRRKARGGKPFAVMARTADDVRHLVRLSPAERSLLEGRARPVVLLRRRPHAGGEPRPAEAVAPGSPDLGVMLPYTPVHHLLLGLPGDPDGPRLLVMTSGNLSGEPIVTDDTEALERLAHLADAWLTHDRPIHVPCDDSVVRVCDGEPLVIRRSRGYTPLPVSLPLPVRPALAVGGDLKNAFCLGAGRQAWLSAHIGDMDDVGTQRVFERAVAQLESITGVRPEALVSDRHPGYRSAGWAARNAAHRPVVRVQHHHAHIAAAMAEHGLDGTRPVIGVAFDGTGHGDDGAVWGGEFLLADYDRFTRFGHLAYVPLPGGDAAVRRPYRMALAHLRAAGIDWSDDLACTTACPPDELHVLERQLERGLNCVPTSSMGRLFDAVSSLAGVCHLAGYEAQAAVELEGAALHVPADDTTEYAFALHASEKNRDGAVRADPAPVLAAIVGDLRVGVEPALVAARFHRGVTGLVHRMCARARERHGLDTVALTGGVFANTLLSSACAATLREDGFTVLRHHLVPPNDGGLALGQLMVAARTTPTD
ncbi:MULTISPECIES: carbamoyltransferase HypF [unclassified Streptomyces]|uniref:carbamoyltransferase HypF n=1 Tax=unclassified Streptomyces TaxID=2593676 RepID=UPI0024752430|nr:MULTISPECIES: carbamoyltransferase HypF [unclassified Streptomyces]MDH6448046.1 hydrogenase maturation protein HypF [Streptomyces sp. SAI-119]MDH6501231.1 hydrogenase maturation protein HypF [Streptomyces sp. SAI-149]